MSKYLLSRYNGLDGKINNKPKIKRVSKTPTLTPIRNSINENEQWTDEQLIQSQYETEAKRQQVYTASKYGIDLNRPSDCDRISQKEKEWRILNRYAAKLEKDREYNEYLERRRVIEEQRQMTEFQIANHQRVKDFEKNYKVMYYINIIIVKKEKLKKMLKIIGIMKEERKEKHMN